MLYLAKQFFSIYDLPQTSNQYQRYKHLIRKHSKYSVWLTVFYLLDTEIIQ